jgi:hypothetical protein
VTDLNAAARKTRSRVRGARRTFSFREPSRPATKTGPTYPRRGASAPRKAGPVETNLSREGADLATVGRWAAADRPLLTPESVVLL